MAKTSQKDHKAQTNSDAMKRSGQEDSETPHSWSEIKHFKPAEFTCHCSGDCDHPVAISLGTVAKLDRIRESIGKPMKIVSGTRCQRYNKKCGGKPLSAHLARNGLSHAADIRCSDSEFRHAFLSAALEYFNRIGIGRDFIHVDDDPGLPAHVVWLYEP